MLAKSTEIGQTSLVLSAMRRDKIQVKQCAPDTFKWTYIPSDNHIRDALQAADYQAATIRTSIVLPGTKFYSRIS